MPAKKSVTTGSKSFPHKLHALLESAEDQGFANIISWQAGGKSFRVHQPKLFVKTILPQHFKQTKFKSFLRQLNIYGFQRIQHGPNKGGYAHSHLLQGFPECCSMIKRVSVPESKAAIAIASSVLSPPPSVPLMTRKRSNNSISNMSNISGLSSIFRAAGSTGSLGSLGSLGMNGPEGNVPAPTSGAQNATFNLGSSNGLSNVFGSTGSLGNNSLGDNSFGVGSIYFPTSGNQNDPFHLRGDDMSAFGRPFYTANKGQTGSALSLLSNLSGLSGGSVNNLQGLRMNRSELNFFKDLFQPGELKGDIPMLAPSTVTATGTQNASFNTHQMIGKGARGPEYVASNGFLEKKPGMLEPSQDELLGLITADSTTQKNEDLNRSESVFPTKLHRMLQDAKREGFEQIVSWIHGGTAFKVHDVTAFMQQIMPIYFDQSKFESFRRQLNLYGFTRVTRGPSRGMYYHQDFVQNDPTLCKNIIRPKSVRKRRGGKQPEDHEKAMAIAVA